MGTVLIMKGVVAGESALPLFSDIFPGYPDPRPTQPIFSDTLVRAEPTDMASLPDWYTLRPGNPVYMTPSGTVSGVPPATGFAGFQSGLADVDIRATLDRSAISSGNSIGFVMRAGGTLGWNNCVRIVMATDSVIAQRVAATTPVNIGSGALPAGATGPHSVRVTALGAQFSVYFDDDLVLSFTESFNQAATIHGMMADASGDTNFRDLEIRTYAG